MKSYRKWIVAALAGLLFLPATPLMADVIKIETNDWDLRRPLTWTGTFETLDLADGIVTFSYLDGAGTRQTKRIHFSRIYSLQIDNRREPRADFPPTRNALSEPLDTRATSKVDLKNGQIVLDQIPERVYVVQGEDRVGIEGNLVSADVQRALLRAAARPSDDNPDTTAEFRVRRQDLIAWVRTR